jgi:uncharacterized membrane protein YccC
MNLKKILKLLACYLLFILGHLWIYYNVSELLSFIFAFILGGLVAYYENRNL